MTMMAVIRYKDNSLYEGIVNDNLLSTENGKYYYDRVGSYTNSNVVVDGYRGCLTSLTYENFESRLIGYGNLTGTFVKGIIDGYGVFDIYGEIIEGMFVNGFIYGRIKNPSVVNL